MMGGCVPDMHVWPPIRMDWRKTTKTRDSILRMNQTIVYVGFNAGKNIILILRAESPIFTNMYINHYVLKCMYQGGHFWANNIAK